jgi:hypothetical protein
MRKDTDSGKSRRNFIFLACLCLSPLSLAGQFQESAPAEPADRPIYDASSGVDGWLAMFDNLTEEQKAAFRAINRYAVVQGRRLAVEHLLAGTDAAGINPYEIYDGLSVIEIIATARDAALEFHKTEVLEIEWKLKACDDCAEFEVRRLEDALTMIREDQAALAAMATS